jgi:hypothetical protein
VVAGLRRLSCPAGSRQIAWTRHLDNPDFRRRTRSS